MAKCKKIMKPTTKIAFKQLYLPILMTKEQLGEIAHEQNLVIKPIPAKKLKKMVLKENCLLKKIQDEIEVTKSTKKKYKIKKKRQIIKEGIEYIINFKIVNVSITSY